MFVIIRDRHVKNFFRNFLLKVSKMGVETTLIKIVGKYFSKKSRKMEKMVNSMSQPNLGKTGNGKIKSLSSLAIELIKKIFCPSLYAHEIYSP